MEPFSVKWIVFLVFCASLFLAGCAGKETGEVMPAPPYGDILGRWTREASAYGGLDLRLAVFASYRSWPLRTAYIREYAERYQLDGDTADRLLADERARYEETEEFFLAVSTPNVKWNDLEKERSVWRIYLENDRGERTAPLKIRRLDEKDPVIRGFYPFMTPWSYGYIVSFPKYTADSDTALLEDISSFKLIITGVLGKAEVEWDME